MTDMLNFNDTLDCPDFEAYPYGDLGLTFSPQYCTFKVWVPGAEQVRIAIYEDAGTYEADGRVTDHSGGRELTMEEDEYGVWSIVVPGDLEGYYYLYHITYKIGEHENSRYVVDPYAKASSANGQRGAIVNMKRTDPENWENDLRPPLRHAIDSVVYELHVRDFSSSEDAKMNHSGQYLAFAESGIRTREGRKVGIDHLEELGVTHVHLLPVYDYCTLNECDVTPDAYNWGYDPQNYNVPEGSYSSDPHNPEARIRELKKMVQALHARGIRVVVDVVFNHTFSVEDGPFDPVVPGYYYRFNKYGQLSNGSGVGNELATERPMVRKYILDSLLYWAEEYHIDGFRFDLMGLIDTTTMRTVASVLHEKVDPTILIYGEPWTALDSPLRELTLKGSQQGGGFAVFNDNFRNALKGDGDGWGTGFISGASGKEGEVAQGLRGSVHDFAAEPAESVNYVTAHDNLILWDKLVKSRGQWEAAGLIEFDNGKPASGQTAAEAVAACDPHRMLGEDPLDHDLVKRQLLAYGLVLTSQGIPFISAGDELLRSKFGDHNSYRSPDAVNAIRWNNKDRFHAVTDYIRGLIELRRSHRAFRLKTRGDIEKHMDVFRMHGGVVGFTLNDHAGGDLWRTIAVVHNATESEQGIELPARGRPWKIVVDGRRAGTQVLGETGDYISVPPLSTLVLYDDEDDYVPEPAQLEWENMPGVVQPGEKVFLHATVRDQRGRRMPEVQVSYLSSDPEKIIIRRDGSAWTIGQGRALITAVCGDMQSSTAILIERRTLHQLGIAMEDEVRRLYVGRSLKLRAEPKDPFGNPMSASRLEWRSSDVGIATVNQAGRVTGMRPGRAVISVSGDGVQAQLALKVREYTPRKLILEYEREDLDYAGWNLWMWGASFGSRRVDFLGEQGGVASVLLEVAPDAASLGFIVRHEEWEKKDIAADRYIDLGVITGGWVRIRIRSGEFRVSAEALNEADIPAEQEKFARWKLEADERAEQAGRAAEAAAGSEAGGAGDGEATGERVEDEVGVGEAGTGAAAGDSGDSGRAEEGEQSDWVEEADWADEAEQAGRVEGSDRTEQAESADLTEDPARPDEHGPTESAIGIAQTESAAGSTGPNVEGAEAASADPHGTDAAAEAEARFARVSEAELSSVQADEGYSEPAQPSAAGSDDPAANGEDAQCRAAEQPESEHGAGEEERPAADEQAGEGANDGTEAPKDGQDRGAGI
ncbi:MULTISPECIES: type I pullulanase [Saccharibacillus]|uniref:type I pullulanase n=1 Tax=Saccharibacillus TaxID=456492 RepID=UPI001EFFCB26|nr:type I pullulanase [Saccharibacillus sp. WB 17]